MKRVFISDCEGPISKNDNAFELTKGFVTNGDRIFSLVSRYDDVLADVVKKPGYNPGDTLKLILPFLKAFGVTDKQMREFSAENIMLVPDIKESLRHINSISGAFIVSTSYEHYIRVLCDALKFPFENVFCTRLTLDKYDLSDSEKLSLKGIAKEIAQKPMIEIPDSAKSINDFSEKDQETIGQLNEIFWQLIVSMSVGRIFSDVVPIGGRQKAEAVKAAAERSGVELKDIIYVGDSITDVDAFKLVRSNGGLTISFNGNQYAIQSAEVAVMSESSMTIAYITDLFCALPKTAVMESLNNWKRTIIESSPASTFIKKRLFEIYHTTLPEVKIVTSENRNTLVQESSRFRKKVRGEAIGRLG